MVVKEQRNMVLSDHRQIYLPINNMNPNIGVRGRKLLLYWEYI